MDELLQGDLVVSETGGVAASTDGKKLASAAGIELPLPKNTIWLLSWAKAAPFSMEIWMLAVPASWVYPGRWNAALGGPGNRQRQYAFLLCQR